MTQKKLHPTIHDFRNFINNHPKLRREIRKTGRSWQEYYEKWTLLGEDDSFWDKFKDTDTTSSEKDENNKGELFNQLMKYMENVDIDKVQKQVHQLSGTIGTIQQLIDQFQGANKKESHEQPNNLFSLFKD